MLGMEEELEQTSFHPGTTQYLPNRQLSEKLSDWTNRCDISFRESSSLPKLPGKGGGKKLEQSNSMELVTPRKSSSVLANPVMIKFNQQVSRNSLRRSQLLFHKILRN